MYHFNVVCIHIAPQWINNYRGCSINRENIMVFYLLLPQLIATLIHYLCTVALPGLADWSAFLEWVLLIMKSLNLDNGTHGRH